MELEERLAKAHEELASGNLTLEENAKLKVIRPVLRSLGWDDADSAHLRAEYQTDNGKVDDALLDSAGRPAVFVESKKQGHLDDPVRRDVAERQLFGYARRQPVSILLLTDGNTWDFHLRRARGSPAERRYLSLNLTDQAALESTASELRKFLSRDAVLEGKAVEAAEERLAHEAERVERRRELQEAWGALLDSAHESLQALLADRVKQDHGQPPAAALVVEFLRAEGEMALKRQSPELVAPRTVGYSKMFPGDRPRADYTSDELSQMASVEVADVVEWWETWWEREQEAVSDSLSSDLQFIRESQDAHSDWVATANEIRDAAEDRDDIGTHLESLRIPELRDLAERLDIETSGVLKQGLVEELVFWIGRIGD